MSALSERSESKGFTLVELLVVITIIAILAAIGMFFYSKFLQQARDGKRQSDLRSIQSVLEQYHADQHFYPNAMNFGSPLTNCTGNTTPCTVTKTYINTVPTDPTTGTTKPYRYEKSPSTCDNVLSTDTKCTSYCLYADLENASIPSLCADISGYDMEVSPP